jgi:hypothetical protein
MDFEKPSNLSISTVETLVNNTPSSTTVPFDDYNVLNLLAQDTNTSSITRNTSQQQISGLLNKVCVLSFHLQAEQQKTNLLQKIIDMQQEKLTQLQSITAAPEVPSSESSIEDQFLKRELEAKVTFLEEKCLLQEQIMNLQNSWIEDLQWTCEENDEAEN